jgi:hypothetical protein
MGGACLVRGPQDRLQCGRRRRGSRVWVGCDTGGWEPMSARMFVTFDVVVEVVGGPADDQRGDDRPGYQAVIPIGARATLLHILLLADIHVSRSSIH